jgi:hypothetical protein
MEERAGAEVTVLREETKQHLLKAIKYTTIKWAWIHSLLGFDIIVIRRPYKLD